MILVTGGAGFIGSNIVAGLADADAGAGDVVVADRLGSGEKWQNLARHEIAGLIAPEGIREFVQKHGNDLEAIIHMGAISATTERDVDLIAESNIRLSLDLWALAAEHGIRLIHASSAATYGDGAAGFGDDETPEALARLRPLNAYGWSKHVVDRRIARLIARDGPRPPQWAGLKFFNVYGPNEYHKGEMRSVVAKVHGAAHGGEAISLFKSYRADYADGGQLRDFIYVKDCVDIVLWFLENSNVSGLFNVGTGQARSWLDLAGALFQALGKPEKVEFIDMPEGLRERYQYFTEAEMGKLRTAGYDRPFTSLEDGIADYVSTYLEQADPYR